MLFGIVLDAQQIQFEQVSTNDGLSQNSVVSIAQDSSGFLWFATQDGLNKYDGSNYSQYEVFFRDKTAQDYNELGKIMADDGGGIWMTTYDEGLQYFYPSTEKFTYVKGVEDASFILQRDTMEFWVSSFTHGLYKILIDGDDIQVEHILDDIAINKLIQYGDQFLLSTQVGLIKFDIETSGTTNLFSGLKNISDVIVSDEALLIISTLGHGLYAATDENSIVKYLDLPTDLLIQDIHIDKSDRFWVATYGDGLYLAEGSTVTQYKTNPLDDTSISYNDILCIFEDKDDNLWFGTDGGGASYIVADRKPIYSITNNRMPKNAPVDVVRSIATDTDSNLWIGTSGKGLTMVSQNMSVIKHYNTAGSPPSKLSSDRIMSLHHDDQQDLWIGTQDGGLMRKQVNTEKIEKVNGALPAETIWDIKQADKDQLWLCTGKQGLILLNKSDLTWKKLLPRNGFEALIDGNIRTMIEGTDGEFFVGTEDGEVFGVRTDSRKRKIDINRKNIGAIKSLYLDGDMLWVGTQKSGIIVVDQNSGKQIELNKSTGLPNNVVYSILEQDDQYVWISTNMGICQIDKKKCYDQEGDIVVQHLTVENGLIGNEYNTGAYHMDDHGTMYFGGIDGINWFEPDEITIDNDPIGIVLLDLITTNRDGQDIKHINDLSSIELKHTDRNFQIRYVAQSYAKTKTKTKYQYKLEGINTEWIDNESNELVSFSNIPPGEYTLLINATNNDGVWAKEPVRFDIDIIPAFWQTWWFSLLAVVGVIGLVWYLFTIRVNEIRKTSALKEQITKVEAKALKLQMNPHFLFNSLNAIDNYILKNEKLIASDYLSKFSKLMRQILDYSEQNRITLTQELATLELYIKMEQLRFQNKFAFELEVDKDVNTNTALLPPLILQPFVENAIWHGLMHLEHGGELKVKIESGDHGIKCIIDDNGIGRDSAKQIKTKSATKHKSHGIRITQERINLDNELHRIGANITIEDKYDKNSLPAGTMVTIDLPTITKA